MLKLTIRWIIAAICLFSVNIIDAQHYDSFSIHSHNDYEQKSPFWNAYANGLTSIEVDIFLKNNTLYVTHTESEIVEHSTIQSLYLEPLLREAKSGKITDDIQLLIDLKSEAKSTLKEIVKVLKKYPELTSNPKISFVISGNRPAPENYSDYPGYILFDWQDVDNHPAANWDKVALVSVNFADYSVWNGLGRLTAEDKESVVSVIEKAHAGGKPFRFWGAPDTKSAWKAFAELGVDYINTDQPAASSEYLGSLKERTFTNTDYSVPYTPGFESDRTDGEIQNVILLIGDGFGLTQLSATIFANNNTSSITQLKSIGLMKTQSADDFTTDSAAAGTALATGEKTNNRTIGTDTEGKPLENITEFLDKHNFASGIITTDRIVGATPSAFYAHQKERSYSERIARDLLNSKISLLVGGGKTDFEAIVKQSKFTVVNQVQDIASSTADKVCWFMAPGGVPSVLKGRKDDLAQATKYGLEYLNDKKKPFFLMVEGAQIDWGGHANNTDMIITEGIDFDKAVTEAIRFADTHKNTLVIITADHETSGFSIPQGNIATSFIEGDFTTHDHTGVMVPVFAYGPHSDAFNGVYKNTDIFHKIITLLQLNERR
ncbi:alkaline phosphatase [Sinomicrobium kalidii]|uniref:alkaline phosphatase n=1 Tax=Sinomicrobium kalidii TaxID=2900738 RepID=UPI001E5C01D5|nr:alkaline phosphatase [Sinomicrobium kalidii]UGU16471.1 alkaline phosphatase [Sinomicrobium kalidii]